MADVKRPATFSVPPSMTNDAGEAPPMIEWPAAVPTLYVPWLRRTSPLFVALPPSALTVKPGLFSHRPPVDGIEYDTLWKMQDA